MSLSDLDVTRLLVGGRSVCGYWPLQRGLTQLCAESRYETRLAGTTSAEYETWASLTQRPASSSSDGASYVNSWTNLTTSGLLRRLSSTSGRRMMSGGSVASWLWCRLSDWSRWRLMRLRGSDVNWLSLNTSDTNDVTWPSSTGKLDKRFPPRYKISSLTHTHRERERERERERKRETQH